MKTWPTLSLTHLFADLTLYQVVPYGRLFHIYLHPWNDGGSASLTSLKPSTVELYLIYEVVNCARNSADRIFVFNEKECNPIQVPSRTKRHSRDFLAVFPKP